jgi:hypothetical protein
LHFGTTNLGLLLAEDLQVQIAGCSGASMITTVVCSRVIL